jgi:antitoxin component of MazEF toxin-antitoxin module
MPHEETRKIIRVGNSFAVTMPRAWLRYFKLKNKDEVKVISNGTVIIQPPAKKAEK